MNSLHINVNKDKQLGQYFTERYVINYIVEVCESKVKQNDSKEIILDPLIGTGGFIACANSINKNKNINNTKNTKNTKNTNNTNNSNIKLNL